MSEIVCADKKGDLSLKKSSIVDTILCKNKSLLENFLESIDLIVVKILLI